MKFLTHVMVALMAAGVMQSASTVGPLVIRFSHVVAPASSKGQAAEKFAQLLSQRTAGKVRVDLFPNSQLCGDQDKIAALLMGSVEMLAPCLDQAEDVACGRV